MIHGIRVFEFRAVLLRLTRRPQPLAYGTIVSGAHEIAHVLLELFYACTRQSDIFEDFIHLYSELILDFLKATTSDGNGAGVYSVQKPSSIVRVDGRE